MKNEEDHRIVINKSNLDLDNFYENKFEINLNRVSFIFIAIFILVFYIQQGLFTCLQKL